jgi:hypothetical protein
MVLNLAIPLNFFQSSVFQTFFYFYKMRWTMNSNKMQSISGEMRKFVSKYIPALLRQHV